MDIVLDGLQKISADLSKKDKAKKVLMKSLLPVALLATGAVGGMYGPRVFKNLKSMIPKKEAKWTKSQELNFMKKFDDFMKRKKIKL